MPPNIGRELEFKERFPRFEPLDTTPLVQILNFEDDVLTGGNNSNNNEITTQNRTFIGVFDLHIHNTNTAATDRDTASNPSEKPTKSEKQTFTFLENMKLATHMLLMCILLGMELDDSKELANRLNSTTMSLVEQRTVKKLWNFTTINTIMGTVFVGGIISGCVYRRNLGSFKIISSLASIYWALQVTSIGIFIQYLNPNSIINIMVGKFICACVHGLRTTHLLSQIFKRFSVKNARDILILVYILLVEGILLGAVICDKFGKKVSPINGNYDKQFQNKTLLKQSYLMFLFYIFNCTPNQELIKPTNIDLYPDILSHTGLIINYLITKCYLFIKTRKFKNMKPGFMNNMNRLEIDKKPITIKTLFNMVNLIEFEIFILMSLYGIYDTVRKKIEDSEKFTFTINYSNTWCLYVSVKLVMILIRHKFDRSVLYRYGKNILCVSIGMIYNYRQKLNDPSVVQEILYNKSSKISYFVCFLVILTSFVCYVDHWKSMDSRSTIYLYIFCRLVFNIMRLLIFPKPPSKYIIVDFNIIYYTGFMSFLFSSIFDDT